MQLHYLEAWVSVWTSLSDDLPLCNPSSHRPIAITPRQAWRQKTLSWLPQVPTSQASSPHNCPGGWRRCHVAQKLCRDGKVIIPGVSVLLCLFAIPVSSSMHFLFIFPAHCYFFFLLDGNSSSAIRKSSCLQLLSFLPSVAGGVIVLSCRSLKSIFFSFSLLIYQLGSPKNTRDALEIKTLGNSLQGCVQGFGETNKRKSSLQGQGAAITPGSEDGKRSHSSWSLGRGRAGSWREL